MFTSRLIRNLGRGRHLGASSSGGSMVFRGFSSDGNEESGKKNRRKKGPPYPLRPRACAHRMKRILPFPKADESPRPIIVIVRGKEDFDMDDFEDEESMHLVPVGDSDEDMEYLFKNVFRGSKRFEFDDDDDDEEDDCENIPDDDDDYEEDDEDEDELETDEDEEAAIFQNVKFVDQEQRKSRYQTYLLRDHMWILPDSYFMTKLRESSQNAIKLRKQRKDDALGAEAKVLMFSNLLTMPRPHSKIKGEDDGNKSSK